MGDKTRALKNAARRRMTETGQSYEAAYRDVRRDYETGPGDDTAEQDRMGFAGTDTPREERILGTAFYVAWGVSELLTRDEIAQMIAHAEKYGTSASTDPIRCHLCDHRIIVAEEPSVHLGLTLMDAPGDREVLLPVWTHEACGRARVWAWSQLTLERRRRGMPVDNANLPPRQRKRGRAPAPIEDYYGFTTLEGSLPVFYLQAGEPHRHGPLGFRADRLSDGLPTLNLASESPRALPEWSLAADRTGRLLHITRQGTGRWYQPPQPWVPGDRWLAAAHYHHGVLLLTAPADAVPTSILDSPNVADFGSLLSTAGRTGHLFGAIITLEDHA